MQVDAMLEDGFQADIGRWVRAAGVSVGSKKERARARPPGAARTAAVLPPPRPTSPPGLFSLLSARHAVETGDSRNKDVGAGALQPALSALTSAPRPTAWCSPTAKRQCGGAGQQTLATCPLCAQRLPADQLQEHLQHELDELGGELDSPPQQPRRLSSLPLPQMQRQRQPAALQQQQTQPRTQQLKSQSQQLKPRAGAVTTTVTGLQLAPSGRRSGDSAAGVVDAPTRVLDAFDHWGDSASGWLVRGSTARQ